jgi:hypothetical protein
MNPQSVLAKSLATTGGNEPRIRAAFLCILSRDPTDKELALFSAADAGSAKGVPDLVWTLVNSREFLFVQ